MLRKLALSLAIAGALGTSNANALGLGEIRITSALNEPLQAEIQLLQMRSVDPQQIQPRMANIDEFALAGIEKLRFLSDVQFEVKPGASGRGTIILTSSAPVKEPFLNFLVEVNWPSGRLVREYTVLLDPPIYDPTPPPVAMQPARSNAVSSTAPVAAKQMEPQKPANNIRTRMTDGQVYVDVNDTLWDIAKRHKPNNSVSEAQMMLALQRKNPDAFRNNNVNQLKAGVVMDLPSLEEVQALNQKQANEEFWRQTQMWKQGIVPEAEAQQIDTSGGADEKAAASGKKGEEVAAKSAQGQLKIVSPDTNTETSTVSDQAADTDMSQADSALLEKNKQLETELATALETVDQIQRENDELSGRVDALAQQMESLQRLLELKDQQLADLQAELESAKMQPVTPAEPAEPAKPAAKSLLEQFGLYIGAAGGAIVAFLLALLFLRRGKKEESEEAIVPGQAIAAAETAEEVVEEETPAPVVADIEEAVPEETDLDELDLDLDMDLDKVDTADAQVVNEEEFDLGFDEDLTQVPSDLDAENTEEVDDALDSILGEDAQSFDLDDLAQPVVEDLGSLPEEEPEAENLDELLAGGDDLDDTEQDQDDETDDLEFDLETLDGSADETAPVEELDEDDLDLDFNLDATDEESAMADEDQDVGEDLDLAMEELSLDTEEQNETELEASDAEALNAEEFDDLDALIGDAHEDESAAEDNQSDADAELDELLSGVDDADIEELEVESGSDDLGDDLDADLQAMLDAAEDEVVLDEEELSVPESGDNESTLGEDLDAELDSELEMLLNDAGSDELSLDVEDDDSEDGSLDGLNLLEGADEVETKLDLARAYIDMEDLDGAKDILEEILKEGSEAQQAEANSLLSSIN